MLRDKRFIPFSQQDIRFYTFGRTCFTIILCAAIISPGVASRLAAAGVTPTTIILVRHAEKSESPSSDPHLTCAGETRAQELALVLGHAGITAIYASPAARTQETAQPLAQRLGLRIAVLDGANKIVQDIQSKHEGQTVLVVGHSNTIPEIMRLLHGDLTTTIGEQEFDDLFVLTMNQEANTPTSSPLGMAINLLTRNRICELRFRA